MKLGSQNSPSDARHDSVHSNPNIFHRSKPIRPSRSNAFKSQKRHEKSDGSIALTAHALAAITPQDEAKANTATHDRIIQYLKGLPDVQSPSDPDLDGDFATDDNENETPFYYTPPRNPQASTTYLRFQEMKLLEPEARFRTHQAWLTLDFSQAHGNPVFNVGVQDTQHADRIHKQILWLRDKWVGASIPVRYYIMEYTDGPDCAVAKGSKTCHARGGYEFTGWDGFE